MSGKIYGRNLVDHVCSNLQRLYSDFAVLLLLPDIRVVRTHAPVVARGPYRATGNGSLNQLEEIRFLFLAATWESVAMVPGLVVACTS